VPNDLALVPERLVVLAVGWFVLPVGTAEQAVSAGVDEVSCAFQIPLLSGDPEQLDESHLDLLVAIDGVAVPLLRPEGVADVVGETRGDVEEALRSCGPEVGHGCLEEVARAVHLVQIKVGPALSGSNVKYVFRYPSGLWASSTSMMAASTIRSSSGSNPSASVQAAASSHL
jgi:hypothetical protein